MLQQLTITTTDKTMLKPLIESALENEKKMLALGIERTLPIPRCEMFRS